MVNNPIEPRRYRLTARNSRMRLAFFFTATGQRGKRVPFHGHEALELVYYIRGKGTSTIGAKPNKIVPHAFTITPAGIKHNQRNDSELTSICMGIIGSGLEDLRGCWVDHGEKVHDVLMRLLAEMRQQQSGFEVVCEGLALEVVGLARRAAAGQPERPSKQRVVSRAIDLIHQRKGVVSVADLSRELYVSKDYLRHLFQEYAGDSPMRHIISVRIERAKTLLDCHDLGIAEIAARAGFENPYYFSRLFKQVTGMTPSDYRGKVK